jgi:hypothetical protein
LLPGDERIVQGSSVERCGLNEEILCQDPGFVASDARISADENDLWIAAMALVLDATLVARDRDFRTIEGLALVEP